jgi:CBS domain containing-hemolysin-like protein
VLAWSVPIRWIYAVMWPVRTMASFMDEVVRRLSGKTDADEAEAAQEELLSVVDEVKREGQIDETARDMIEAAVELRRDTTVAQIMTPRTEMESMEMTDDLSKITDVDPSPSRPQPHPRVRRLRSIASSACSMSRT